MKKSLVLGNNTSMSLSPHIFNYWFKKYEIDGEYTFKETDIKNFEYEYMQNFRWFPQEWRWGFYIFPKRYLNVQNYKIGYLYLF